MKDLLEKLWEKNENNIWSSNYFNCRTVIKLYISSLSWETICFPLIFFSQCNLSWKKIKYGIRSNSQILPWKSHDWPTLTVTYAFFKYFPLWLYKYLLFQTTYCLHYFKQKLPRWSIVYKCSVFKSCPISKMHENYYMF